MKLLGFLLAIVTSFGLAIYVQQPYWQARHAGDDVDHVREAEKYIAGELDFLSYVGKPHNEHLLPLWKFWYAQMWRTFSDDPRPWHICITCAHAFGALCLFGIIRSHTGSFVTALSCCSLWSATAIGQWDNPLQWIAASHLTFGFAWMLAALLCASRLNDGPRALCGFGMAACFLCAFLSMGSMLLLCPMLPIQYLTFRDRGRPIRDDIPWWLVWWLIPVILCAGLQLSQLSLKSQLNPELGWQAPKGDVSVKVGVLLTVKSYCTAIGDLIVPLTRSESKEFHNQVLAAAALVAAAFFLDRQGFKTVAVLGGMTILFSLAAFIARSPWGEAATTFSRLRYLPTFGWCVLLSATAVCGSRKLPNKLAWIVLLIWFSCCGFLVQQQAEFAQQSYQGFVQIVK